MNVWDIVIALAVTALVVRALAAMRKRKKSGKCSCGNCDSCPGSRNCGAK